MNLVEIFHLVIVAVVVIGLFIAFAKEWRPPEVSAAIAVAVLLVTGVISPETLVATFSNPAPITIGALFILSAALVRTGAFEAVAGFLTEHGENRLAAGAVAIFGIPLFWPL